MKGRISKRNHMSYWLAIVELFFIRGRGHIRVSVGVSNGIKSFSIRGHESAIEEVCLMMSERYDRVLKYKYYYNFNSQ